MAVKDTPSACEGSSGTGTATIVGLVTALISSMKKPSSSGVIFNLELDDTDPTYNVTSCHLLSLKTTCFLIE